MICCWIHTMDTLDILMPAMGILTYPVYNLIKLNLQPLNERRKNLCSKFAQSGIKNQTMTDLFKENKKIHMMHTRYCETHAVDFCNTERYLKSSVPYMQHLLNDSSY